MGLVTHTKKEKNKREKNEMTLVFPPNLVLQEEFHTRLRENGCDDPSQ